MKINMLRVGITMGDPSGIGPAITLKAVRRLSGLADFTVIGDEWVFNKGYKDTRIQGYKYRFIDLDNVAHKNFAFGEIRAEYGRASIEYLDKALKLIKDKKIDCLVTCPVSKEAINKSGLSFSGHTEYLARYADVKDFVMMLLNKNLRISLVTRHTPLKDVPGIIDKEILQKTIILTHKSLRQMFGLDNPRIAVCGLNPHASDNGVIGAEENKVIKPAIQALPKSLRINIYGPYSADVAIWKTKNKEFDCAVAMFHDQALIPLKLYGSDTGVNLTLGLPFIRTSPLHGTAFDLASYFNKANPDSLIEAIRLAIQCTSNLKRN